MPSKTLPPALLLPEIETELVALGYMRVVYPSPPEGCECWTVCDPEGNGSMAFAVSAEGWNIDGLSWGLHWDYPSAVDRFLGAARAFAYTETPSPGFFEGGGSTDG